MRTLKRNKQKFYYSNYTGMTPVKVGNEETGEYELTYSAPVECSGNISGAKGSSSVQLFGDSDNYSRTISLAGTAWAFDTQTRLWIGITPGTQQNPVNHNYEVTRVSKTINSTVLAVKEVEVS